MRILLLLKVEIVSVSMLAYFLAEGGVEYTVIGVLSTVIITLVGFAKFLIGKIIEMQRQNQEVLIRELKNRHQEEMRRRGGGLVTKRRSPSDIANVDKNDVK